MFGYQILLGIYVFRHLIFYCLKLGSWQKKVCYVRYVQSTTKKNTFVVYIDVKFTPFVFDFFVFLRLFYCLSVMYVFTVLTAWSHLLSHDHIMSVWVAILILSI